MMGKWNKRQIDIIHSIVSSNTFTDYALITCSLKQKKEVKIE